MYKGLYICMLPGNLLLLPMHKIIIFHCYSKLYYIHAVQNNGKITHTKINLFCYSEIRD